MSSNPDFITEDWLKSVGFKWHQLERQPSKHWVLWLGSGLVDHEGNKERASCSEDLGIELTCDTLSAPFWYCWLRSDASHRYHRFIHIRHLRTQQEVVALIESLTGLSWNPENHLYGEVKTPADAKSCRDRDSRLDAVLLRENPSWYPTESDESQGRPLPEHLHAHKPVTTRADAPALRNAYSGEATPRDPYDVD